MAVKRILTKVRPNTGVDFGDFSTSVKDYITTNYINTGKQTENISSVSEDGLTKTSQRTFINSTVKDEFEADSTISEANNSLKISLQGNGVLLSKTITED